MKTRGVRLPTLTVAAPAAALFWAIYLVECGLFMSSYWLGDPRLAATGALTLVVWLASGVLWLWTLSIVDDKVKDAYLAAHPGENRYYADQSARHVAKRQGKRRLRRRRWIVIPIMVAVVIAACVLFAIAIWRPHGDDFGITGVMLLGACVPLVFAVLED